LKNGFEKQKKRQRAGRCLFLNPETLRRWLIGADGVPDGSSYAKHVGGAELILIDDVVVMRFGADEDLAPDVVTNAAANMDEEVIVAGIAGAEIDAIRCGNISVEAGALPADAAHDVGAELLAESGLEDRIEVIQDWPVRLTTIAAAVYALAGSPSHFKVEAKPAVEDNVGTHGGVKATLLCDGWVGETGRVVRGRHQGTEAEHGVGLLS